MFCWLTLAAFVTCVFAGLRAATAALCIITSPGYRLMSDTVDWSMRIGSGTKRSRDFNFNTFRSNSLSVKMEGIRPITALRSGLVKFKDSTHSYSTEANLQGPDTSSLVPVSTAATSKKESAGPSTNWRVLKIGAGGFPNWHEHRQ